MKKNNLHIICMLLPLVVASCFNKDLSGFLGTEISFPMDSLIEINTYVNSSNKKINKMIVWYDETDCSQCKLSQIDKLYNLYSFCNDSVDNCMFRVVFSLKEEISSDSFLKMIDSLNIPFPIIVDPQNVFTKVNKNIPSKSYYHYFLLDRNNIVVIAGCPIGNHSLMELYKSKMRSSN